MILGRLNDRKRYEALNPTFAAAFDFLEKADGLENGHYELTDGAYANIFGAATKPADSFDFEAHRKYIDIQYLLGGHSVMTWARTADLTETVPYSEEKDVLFGSGEGRAVQVKKGDFFILWPEDAHKPNGTDGTPDEYRVVVVKIPVTD